MDIIFIRDLRIETVIGVYAWERRIRQTVCVDLELATDVRPAAKTDSIEVALDYNAVAERIVQFVGASECLLLETLAERIAEIILGEFQVPWLRLTLTKPAAVRAAKAVGIIIERGTRA